MQNPDILVREPKHSTTRAEYETEPDSRKLKDPIQLIAEHYLPR